MKRLICLAVTVALAAMLWPEFERYRAEWSLAQANADLSAALDGTLKGSTAISATQDALSTTRKVIQALPGDPRPIQMASVALLLLQRGDEAIALLEPAIAAGGRPERTLNLGRARGIRGDEKGAEAAFLRTAWVNPSAIATLPKAMRGPLLDRVAELEVQLHNGQLQQPPPL